MSASELLLDRAEGQTMAWLLLAHGAGAPMDSAYMNQLTHCLNKVGVSVARFEFPYMVRRRLEGRKFPPDRMPKLTDAFRQAFQCWQELALPGLSKSDVPVLIGGKSMGGRVASMVADQWVEDGLPLQGVCCFGYPFHPPGKNKDQSRIEHLLNQQTPTLVLQGTRDPFGKPCEINELNLSPAMMIHWLGSGDHDLKPLVRTGLKQQDLLNTAAGHVAQFVETLT